MQGKAGGDGERVRHNTRKHDAPELSLGVANRSAKRRHKAGSPDHDDDDQGMSSSSSSNSRGQKVKKHSASRYSKFPLDTVQLSLRSSGSTGRQKHDALKPPARGDSAAEALVDSGGTRAPSGARLSFPGGLSSGHVHHNAKQNPLSNGPPTSSSTSSDTSSIPAGSTGALPFVASKKKIPQKSFHSLRYGNKSANKEDSPQSHDKPGLETKGRKHTTTSTQRQQSSRQGDALPTPRLDGTRKTPHTITSSDDESYVDEDENNDDDHDEDNDDEDAATFPTTRQRLLRPQRGANNSLKERPDDGIDGELIAKQGPYTTTPSGKDYHQFLGEDGYKYSAKFALFPDRYRLQPSPRSPSYPFSCPVRTCRRIFRNLGYLDNHFESDHSRNEFNDNLDKDGTLEYIGQTPYSGEYILNRASKVVSQTPRHPPVLADSSSTLQVEKERNPVEVAAKKASEESSGVRLHKSLFSGRAQEDWISKVHSDLDRAMAESKVWAYVAPHVPKSWILSVTGGLETRAFVQILSLPLRNEMDMEWLAGTKNSHQRLYRALMSIIFHVVGAEAHCKPCESKTLERKRNCKELPAEAVGMRELQEICGSQCVNCYFFQASKPCKFLDSSTTTKETPVPVPVPPASRLIPNVEHSSDSPSDGLLRPPAVSRPHPPSYSLYKAWKTEKPISETPVPIPSFAVRGPTSQSELQDKMAVPSEKTSTKSLRRSDHISKIDSESGKSRGITENHGLNESHPSPETPAASAASGASIDGPLRSALASGRSNAKASPETASNLSCGDTSGPELTGRMFSLFGDIGRLPAEEQAVLWNQMLQMSAMLQTGSSGVSSAFGSLSDFTSLRVPLPAADQWEIAPGRLIVDDKHLAFSTSFLSRDVISLNAAQQLSPTQRVLNNSIPALKQLRLVPEEGWNCTCSVIRGLLKMKVGDVEARIGQGGVISVEKECIITNLSHKEARIQMWWVEKRD